MAGSTSVKQKTIKGEHMLSRQNLSVSILAFVLGVFVVNSVALAEYGEKKHGKKWRQVHPRQNEVNNRLQHQTNRANNQAADGKITQQQANQMQHEDQKIYQQEQADKAKNGGNYITKGQQAQLNREESRVNRQDRRDMAKDAAANSGAPAAPAPAAPPPAPATGN